MIDTKRLLATLHALTEGEHLYLPNLSNAAALLNETLTDINWVGFYLMVDGELVLGPFQGKPACIRIPVGRGVCGSAAQSKQTQRIPDVHAFPGHIACDGNSNSELVVPMCLGDNIIGVLDIDSPVFDRFSVEDQAAMEAFTEMLVKACDWS